jgi:predicted phage terminase large subunit-like protein
VLPLYEAGNVWYPDPSIAPWVVDHMGEILSFPNAKHDDRVDAESQALKYLGQQSLDWIDAMTTL